MPKNNIQRMLQLIFESTEYQQRAIELLKQDEVLGKLISEVESILAKPNTNTLNFEGDFRHIIEDASTYSTKIFSEKMLILLVSY